MINYCIYTVHVSMLLHVVCTAVITDVWSINAMAVF